MLYNNKLQNRDLNVPSVPSALSIHSQSYFFARTMSYDEISRLRRTLHGCMFMAWMCAWKIKYIKNLMDASLNIAVTWNFEKDVEIRGFVNIYHRRWTQRIRRKQRRFLDSQWCDRPSYKKWEKRSPNIYADIFRLRRLFDMEPLVSDNMFKIEDFHDDDFPVEIWYGDASPVLTGNSKF
ncbi:hypothetical protein EAG_11694 [Camponotus floridanus]|uniref:Uncharacterized protein n=1 Tax=Camponotus floridanus TaxID=104421 RepID=E2AQM3_CAMFO|nr:hypothetical protein EAG_11694 [Camponotus floridanus]